MPNNDVDTTGMQLIAQTAANRRATAPLTRQMLASLDLQVLSVQRTQAGRWWQFENVVSPFSRLWLILGGRAHVTQRGRRYELRPGRLHLVPAFEPHDCSCPRRFDHYHLHFSARLPTGIDLFSMLDCDCQFSAPGEALGLLQRLEAIYPRRKLPCFDPFLAEYQEFPARLDAAGDEEPAPRWFEARGVLALLLAPFFNSAALREGTHTRAALQFADVQQFIHENMHRPIALADMARVAGLSPTYFSDRFRQTVGMRPTAYLMGRRMERARYLLLTTRAPVKQIAFEVGMNDPAYFTRVFTRLCGNSPSGYRQSHSP